MNFYASVILIVQEGSGKLCCDMGNGTKLEGNRHNGFGMIFQFIAQAFSMEIIYRWKFWKTITGL